MNLVSAWCSCTPNALCMNPSVIGDSTKRRSLAETSMLFIDVLANSTNFVCNRDLKVENLLLDENNDIKIIGTVQFRLAIRAKTDYQPTD